MSKRRKVVKPAVAAAAAVRLPTAGDKVVYVHGNPMDLAGDKHEMIATVTSVNPDKSGMITLNAHTMPGMQFVKSVPVPGSLERRHISLTSEDLPIFQPQTPVAYDPTGRANTWHWLPHAR